MGIRHLKTQLFAALSFALLASCSTDSGVISKKDGNKQVSSSSDSPIQRLAVEESETSQQPTISGDLQDADSDRQTTQPVAVAAPNEGTEIENSDLQDNSAEP